MRLVVLSTGQEPREIWLRASVGRSNERCWNINLNKQATGTNGPFPALSLHNSMKGPEYFSKSRMIYLLFQNKYLFYTHTHTQTHKELLQNIWLYPALAEDKLQQPLKYVNMALLYLAKCATLRQGGERFQEQRRTRVSETAVVAWAQYNFWRSWYRALLMQSFKHNQQDATLYNILYCCQCSTCFRRVFRPSSGAQTVRTASGVCQPTHPR
jgi:hypothetical protein